jgi:hypothetical protein
MSTASTVPFFGRAYSLTVYPQTGPAAGQKIVISSDQFEPSALRFTFDIQTWAFKSLWTAEISIYNCDGPISSGPSAGVNVYQAVIQEGDLVVLEAGYQADGNPHVIWAGQVFYFTKDRLDVVDQRLTLHCMLNRAWSTQNFINATMPALSTPLSQAQLIAQESITPITINSSQVQSVLGSTKQLPRAKSYFGSPHNYLHDLADQAGALSWFGHEGWNASFFQEPLGAVAASYAPIVPGVGPNRSNGITYTLVGTPQQTQYGVDFRVLLDPIMKVTSPILQVGLQKKFVRQAPIVYGQLPPVPLLDQYAVVGVRYTGDTRGNAWYADITGVAQIQSVVALMGN